MGAATEEPREPDSDRFKSRATRPKVLPTSGRRLRRGAQLLRQKLRSHRIDSHDVMVQEAKIRDLLAQADEVSQARGASVA